MNDEEETESRFDFNVRGRKADEIGPAGKPYRLEFALIHDSHLSQTNVEHASLDDLWMIRDRLDRFLRAQT